LLGFFNRNFIKFGGKRKKNMNNRSFVLVVIFLMIFIVACAPKQNAIETENNLAIDEIVQEKEENNPLEPIKPQVSNPLNGLNMDKEYENQRPLAVMIENEYNSRPQSGLNKADVVYEILTEGGITRFLALFLGNQCGEIGPVRSSRPYFLDYAMEYDSVYVHYGASPQAYSDLKKLKIDAIDGIYDSVTFWRDKSRKAPHNAYTSSEKILNTSEKRGFLRAPVLKAWNFRESSLAQGDTLKEFILTYTNNYKVTYKYNSDDNCYYRYINSKPHTDRTTGQHLSATNIIVQFLNTKVVDDVGRLEIKTVGSGKAYYISNGFVREVEWEKDSRNGRTRYTVDGEELYLNPGNIWIQVMPQWGSFEKGDA